MAVVSECGGWRRAWWKGRVQGLGYTLCTWVPIQATMMT